MSGDVSMADGASVADQRTGGLQQVPGVECGARQRTALLPYHGTLAALFPRSIGTDGLME